MDMLIPFFLIQSIQQCHQDNLQYFLNEIILVLNRPWLDWWYQIILWEAKGFNYLSFAYTVRSFSLKADKMTRARYPLILTPVDNSPPPSISYSQITRWKRDDFNDQGGLQYPKWSQLDHTCWTMPGFPVDINDSMQGQIMQHTVKWIISWDHKHNILIIIVQLTTWKEMLAKMMVW